MAVIQKPTGSVRSIACPFNHTTSRLDDTGAAWGLSVIDVGRRLSTSWLIRLPVWLLNPTFHLEINVILVDYKKGGEKDLDSPQIMVDHLKRMGVQSEKADLQYGDAAFEGNGPDGTMAVGIERKTLHDLLNCIDDGRISGHQLIGMKNMYDVRVVIVEGHWKPHDPQGVLMEGFNGGVSWGYCRYRSTRTMYSKVYRYLISLSLSGAIVTYSRDLWHTSYNIHEWFHYFQKRWDDHTSMRELHKIAVPSLNFKPSLVRKWAQDLEEIGVKKGELAARHFRKPITLATADEGEWLKIPGVGVKTAQSIVREIWGNR